jgi:hypothetical protein
LKKRKIANDEPVQTMQKKCTGKCTIAVKMHCLKNIGKRSVQKKCTQCKIENEKCTVQRIVKQSIRVQKCKSAFFSPIIGRGV